MFANIEASRGYRSLASGSLMRGSEERVQDDPRHSSCCCAGCCGCTALMWRIVNCFRLGDPDDDALGGR